MNRQCKGFILIREYPHSPKIGSFERFSTGFFLKYPEIWKPIYEDETIRTERYIIEVAVKSV